MQLQHAPLDPKTKPNPVHSDSPTPNRWSSSCLIRSYIGDNELRTFLDSSRDLWGEGACVEELGDRACNLAIDQRVMDSSCGLKEATCADANPNIPCMLKFSARNLHPKYTFNEKDY